MNGILARGPDPKKGQTLFYSPDGELTVCKLSDRCYTIPVTHAPTGELSGWVYANQIPGQDLFDMWKRVGFTTKVLTADFTDADRSSVGSVPFV